MSTPYQQSDNNPFFPEIEQDIIASWKEQGSFRASVENRTGDEWVFYDGPPFANGLPHYGHLLTSYVKDTFARYHTMKGKKVERRFGWDCHGLPAEMGAEKELGVSGRAAIEHFGIKAFNDHCRSSVMQYTNVWQDTIHRAGRWVDFDNDYKTMDTTYMESVIWAFNELYNKGLVYESHRVMPYSWAAQTPLSNFETRMDDSYREREDKAITVAFTLKDVPDALKDAFPEVKAFRVCAWTTTPWTLPSNLALAVKGDMTYYGERDGDVVNITAYAPVEEKAETDALAINGFDLIGLSYEPLFPYFKDTENAFRVLEGDFIEEGSGTGVVHLAPGFGEDDQRVCADAGIGIVCPVDEAGCYTDAVFDLGREFTPPPENQRFSDSPIKGEWLTEQAQNMRKDPTEAEKIFWHRVNQKQLGKKFRRQQPIGRYIVDFYCSEARLVIELDGGQHADNAQDTVRSQWLESQGLRVVRFWNNDVLENIEAVLQTLQEHLDNHSPLEGESESIDSGGGDKTQNSIPLSLKGLNVIAQTTGTCDDEPYTEKQLEKNGLVNLRIINYLKLTGQLIKQEDYKHSYPHCWRTDMPLIYKAVPSWYVEVTKFKDRMVELNQEINWIPGHIKDGQFGKWLENARDWSISRNRYWGCPIPIWRTETGKVRSFGSIAEMEEFFGQTIEDLHKPFIDTLTKTDADGTWTRVSDVFDCWFESGSMPYAQVHYPFENKDWFEAHFPADFIVEYVGQTRGWFYTLMVLSTALFDRIPFKNCICHGIILDENGKKLSKRLRNYPDPNEMFDVNGSDAMRWRLMSEPVMMGGNLLIAKDGSDIRDQVRLTIKPIWNAFHFFTLYANTDEVNAKLISDSDNLMDRYILSKLKGAVESIDSAMDAFHTPDACIAVEQFFEVLNNWYIRRSRERFWRKAEDADEDKQAAYDTLYTCLLLMAKAAAPLLPMVSEAIYQGLNGSQEDESSIHLCDFSDVSAISDEAQLLKDMDYVRQVCTAALAVRDKENIRIRQPLYALSVYSAPEAELQLEDFADIIRDELNVKHIVFSNELDEVASLKVQIHFPVAGKRLGAKMKQVAGAAKQGNWQEKDGVMIVGDEPMQPDEYAIRLETKIDKGAQALVTNDAVVVLDLVITDELKQEGIARDVVRMIQQARKDADLLISDRIELHLSAGIEVEKAVEQFADYIKEQTLSVDIATTGETDQYSHNVSAEIEGETVDIGFSKAA